MAKGTQLSTFGKIAVIALLVGVVYGIIHFDDVLKFLWSLSFIRGYVSGLSSFYYIIAQIFSDVKYPLMHDWANPAYGKLAYWGYLLGQLLGSVGSASLLGLTTKKVLS